MSQTSPDGEHSAQTPIVTTYGGRWMPTPDVEPDDVHDYIVEVNAHNAIRLSLNRMAQQHKQYRVLGRSDGSIILEPYDGPSHAERAYAADTELQEIVEYGRAHPEKSRPRPPAH